MDESNYEILNRKSRISKRRFRHDPTRFERSHQRVHRGGELLSLTQTHLYSIHIG